MGPGLDEYFFCSFFFTRPPTHRPWVADSGLYLFFFCFFFPSFVGVIKSKLKGRELDKFLSVRHKHGMYVN
jgi:hypothetical protein